MKVTPVKVGPAQGETTSIQSGLNVGDQVVTDGGDRLSDGARVIQPKDAARFAAMAAKMGKKQPGGILGWIEGLFGHKSANPTASGFDQSADSSASGAPSGAAGCRPGAAASHACVAGSHA